MAFLYTSFHINSQFSSIEERERSSLVRECYWPLLRLIEEKSFHFTIESTAQSLQSIAQQDMSWIEKLAELIADRKATFVGSGFSQIIGPLVPHYVNKKNLDHGWLVYKELLNFEPEILFINEQCYSNSFLNLVSDIGFKKVIVEWESTRHANPDIPSSYRFHPLKLINGITLIWNSSTAFQKAQRAIHRQIGRDEWLDWVLQEAKSASQGGFNIYGGDAETIGYRAKRYPQETKGNPDEWGYLGRGLEDILKQGNTLAGVEDFISFVHSNTYTKPLGSIQTPIIVKKQAKYNINRWAVGGRQNTLTNTRCWRVAEKINSLDMNKLSVSGLWERLLDLYGSDYRTHITSARYNEFQHKLGDIERDLGLHVSKNIFSIAKSSELKREEHADFLPSGLLKFNTKRTEILIDSNKGGSIRSMSFGNDYVPIISSIRHGDLDSPFANADFLTGEFVLNLPGGHKVSDLVPTRVKLISNTANLVELSTQLDLGIVKITKTISINDNYLNNEVPKLRMQYEIVFETLPPCSLRLGSVVLNMENLNSDSVVVQSHSGGREMDSFSLSGFKEVDHGAPVSLLVSSRNSFPLSNREMRILGETSGIQISLDKESLHCPALLTYLSTENGSLFNLEFSLREIDDTSHNFSLEPNNSPMFFSVSIQPLDLSK